MTHRRKRGRVRMADLADVHALYEKSVQSPDHDVPFLASYFRRYTGRPLRRLREDFCGTAVFAACFVKRHPDNRAVGIDLDEATLAWGRAQNVSRLTAGQRRRLTLVHGNVLDPRPANAELIVAMNFSYMVFRTRRLLLRYFRRARASLRPGGLLALDIWGGSESQVPQEEAREIENPDDDGIGDFIFIWDQDVFDPVTYFCTTRIHFRFRDGSRIRNAFVYEWRLWTIAEVMELMKEAGFRDVHCLWDYADSDDEPEVWRRADKGDTDPAWIAYLVGVNPPAPSRRRGR